MSGGPGSSSPYSSVPIERWSKITEGLLAKHPLASTEIVEVVQVAWHGIFETRIANFRIGVDIEPQPQIMGFLLHELIPLEFQRRYPEQWRGQKAKNEKDLVHVEDLSKSIEIKTSSNASQIFGNRSYGQPAKDGEVGRKGKSGYYLTINFEKFGRGRAPALRIVRFGWLDHDDWIAQAAPTGQAARLRPEAYKYKLIELFKA